MGGKPSKGTPRDMRLKSNKQPTAPPPPMRPAAAVKRTGKRK
ncbi:MAG: hypothetical protein JWP14_3391 [Frankiales bacterium]|nr:hypothetical protein [Frankiales bacterium]